MTTSDSNRRRYQRAIFSLDDDIQCIFSIPDSQDRPINSHILNIGQGGIHMVINPRDEARLSSGMKLVLVQIKGGPEELPYLVNVDAEIKWVMSHDILDYIGAGCEFLNISDSSRDQIASFVAAWHNKDEQNN
jgi:c-di-GMP-binding flagellar brake protein YcgR